MKRYLLTVVAAAFALSLSAAGFAQTFSSVFSSSGAEIAAPGAGIGGINNVHVMAGVDTDEDSNEEILYLRIEGDGPFDTVAFRIYENDGTDNGYALKYSEDIIFADSQIGNFNQYCDLTVSDADNSDGPEIILYLGGPFGSPITENLFVYASTADDDWSTSMTLLAGDNTIDDIMGIEVGDVDGDGQDEITLSDDGNDNITIVSVSSGTFAAGTATLVNEVAIDDPALAAGGSLYNHTIADLNGDGQPEIVTTHFNDNGYGVIEGDTPTTYTLVFDDSPGANTQGDGLFSPGNCENWDIDGDGTNAVFGLSSSHGGVYVLTGLSGVGGDLTTLSPSVEMFIGTDFGLINQGTSTNGEQVPGQGLDITDVDGDGNAELLIAAIPDFGTAQDGQVFLLEYNGTGADNDISNYTLIDAATTGITTTGDGIYDAEGGSASGILDMDGDGLAEVVIVGPAINEPGLQVFELPMTMGVENWNNY